MTGPVIRAANCYGRANIVLRLTMSGRLWMIPASGSASMSPPQNPDRFPSSGCRRRRRPYADMAAPMGDEIGDVANAAAQILPPPPVKEARLRQPRAHRQKRAPPAIQTLASVVSEMKKKSNAWAWPVRSTSS
jgi:hypothetical protein